MGRPIGASPLHIDASCRRGGHASRDAHVLDARYGASLGSVTPEGAAGAVTDGEDYDRTVGFPDGIDNPVDMRFVPIQQVS
jgi:hypothetical protein